MDLAGRREEGPHLIIAGGPGQLYGGFSSSLRVLQNLSRVPPIAAPSAASLSRANSFAERRPRLEMVAVGRHGGGARFDTLAARVASSYVRKGYSPKVAARIGFATAGRVYRQKKRKGKRKGKRK